MRKNSARRFAARGRALVVLSVIAMVMLAGCAQGEAADATSDADGADVASEPADGAPEPADEPDVIALCDSFGEFGDDIDTAAVDDWAAQAEGTALAEPAQALAEVARQVDAGDLDPFSDEVGNASLEVMTLCEQQGWEVPEE